MVRWETDGGSKAACGSIWQWKFRLFTDVMSNNEELQSLYTYYFLKQNILPKKSWNNKAYKEGHPKCHNTSSIDQCTLMNSHHLVFFYVTKQATELEASQSGQANKHCKRQVRYPSSSRQMPSFWHQASLISDGVYPYPYHLGFGWARMPGKYSFSYSFNASYNTSLLLGPTLISLKTLTKTINKVLHVYIRMECIHNCTCPWMTKWKYLHKY